MMGATQPDLSYLSSEVAKSLSASMRRTSNAWKKRKAKLALKKQGHGLEAGAVNSCLQRNPNRVSRPMLELGDRVEVRYKVNFSTDLNSMCTRWLKEAAYKRFLRDCTEGKVNVHSIERRARIYAMRLDGFDCLIEELVSEDLS